MSDHNGCTSRIGPRRRDKPQLSCNACRKRKIRCDRLLPCGNCSTRGLASSCEYPATRKQGPVTTAVTSSTNVQSRIEHLESLLLSLMQQQQQQQPASTTEPTPALLDTAQNSHSAQSPRVSGLDHNHQGSPSPSSYGAMRGQGSAASYVGNAHWEAVLDSIVELKDHFNNQSPSQASTPDKTQWQHQQGINKRHPLLLYAGSPQATTAAILEAMPPRSTVDRLVHRYFNDLDMATGALHSDKFFREYEEFWNYERETPVNIIWVGLLFAIMCLSTQFQQLLLSPTDTDRAAPLNQETQKVVDMFREKTVQCLILGGYAKGGPFVLETLILYFLGEVFPLKEIDIGIWILVGNIVQIATYMGYHRDAMHFADISPFAGEMRRRLWSMIVQIDFSISTQLGQSRLINETQSNTAEPRNLLDSDFDEDTIELPPSRPETEVTPILYTLAKLRIVSVGSKINDMIAEPDSYQYTKVVELDREIEEAHDRLPPYMKWENLKSSLTCSPLVIIQRVWLEICIQRLKMILHKKFLLVPSSGSPQQQRLSESTCVTAAARIVEFHHLIDEETRVDGRLFQIRWRVSTATTHEFLLATSVLCFYLQTYSACQTERSSPPQHKPSPPRDAELVDKVKRLLTKSQVIWQRLASESLGARKAYTALCYVLGDSKSHSVNVVTIMSASAANTAISQFPGFLDLMPGYNLAMLEPPQMDNSQFRLHQMAGDTEDLAEQYMDFTS